MKYFRYLSYLVIHKWFVFLECYKLGIPWCGIIHDWSKFRVDEFIPYARHFFGRNRDELIKKEKVEGYDKSKDRQDISFNRAWLYHIHRNRHHWEYWTFVQGEGGNMVLEMPDRYRRELLADWHATGRILTGKNNTREWYLKHKNRFRFYPNTRKWLEERIGI